MYLLRYVYQIHSFPYTVLAPKDLLGKLVILYHCAALVLKFEVDASVSLEWYRLVLQIMSLIH